MIRSENVKFIARDRKKCCQGKYFISIIMLHWPDVIKFHLEKVFLLFYDAVESAFVLCWRFYDFSLRECFKLRESVHQHIFFSTWKISLALTRIFCLSISICESLKLSEKYLQKTRFLVKCNFYARISFFWFDYETEFSNSHNQLT